MKYKIGEVYNNREIIAYANNLYLVKCLSCGAITKQTTSLVYKTCRCSMLKKKRCSGLTYELPKGRIEELKEKYKNGVTREHIEALFR